MFVWKKFSKIQDTGSGGASLQYHSILFVMLIASWVHSFLGKSQGVFKSIGVWWWGVGDKNRI